MPTLNGLGAPLKCELRSQKAPICNSADLGYIGSSTNGVRGSLMTIKIAAAVLCALIVVGCAGTQTKFHPVDWKHDTVNPHE